jgi:hypothetical protein
VQSHIQEERVMRNSINWIGIDDHAPHGSGKAVKFKNKSEVDFTKLHGDWM